MRTTRPIRVPEPGDRLVIFFFDDRDDVAYRKINDRRFSATSARFAWLFACFLDVAGGSIRGHHRPSGVGDEPGTIPSRMTSRPPVPPAGALLERMHP